MRMTQITSPEPHPPRLALRVAEAAQALSISRSKCYQLIASHELPSVQIGKSIRVPNDELKRWLTKRVSDA
jgi:excisionase family DNA binding protein|tara:strand:+ start:278 stop:490 length:213 start_codon:yes stop_codon:yes gene_type:complete